MNAEQRKAFIDALKLRFAQNKHRHPAAEWAAVLDRLQASTKKLSSLFEMEQTGGEPDVIGAADHEGAYLFCDCAAETPQGRRSLCFDAEALHSRKENKPGGNVIDTAAAMDVALLTEAQYRALQTFGEFDLKTSSWIATPPEIRKLGGALFCDRRYGMVFVYHNGAQSYYASRGFRASLRI
ncbi:DUF4256 domain-containing protein [Variovorax boronicumulans]|uniref:DUF4256 domain-containing protein n=1 Tax=Variovorax boronicumulans TaxID=436515 RepID=UPI003393F43E